MSTTELSIIVGLVATAGGGLFAMARLFTSFGSLVQKHVDLDRRHAELAADLRPRLVKAEENVAVRKEEHNVLVAKVDGLKEQLDRIEGAVISKPRRKA